MTVSANNGNAYRINSLEADPNDTPSYDARLESAFLAMKVQFLGDQGTKNPFPFPLVPIHLIPDANNPSSQPGIDPKDLVPDATSLTEAELLDPNIEPQFQVPDVPATMGVPNNFNLFPEGDPSPADVNQHGLKNCYFDAVLASMAAQNPNFVKNMVQANPDGTYTVHLFDPNGNRVDVTVNNELPMDSNGNLVGVCGPNNQGNWASIVEKAFAKYNDAYHVINFNPTGVGYDSINVADNDEGFFRVLTGVGASFTPNRIFETPEEQDAFAQKMHDAINNGQTVWATTSWPTTSTPQIIPNGDQIEAAHSYSVIDVNKDADGNWYVDLRNPWGHNSTAFGDLFDDNKHDGVVRLSISDYCKYMSEGTSIGDKSLGLPANNGWQPPGGVG